MRSILFLITSATLVAATASSASQFEVPTEEPPSASLTAEEASGENFRVVDPVRSDGLMRHYVLDGRFGTFPAYGRPALAVRRHEIAAISELSKITDIDVVVRTVGRGVTADVAAVAGAARDPVGLVVGIPKGIENLFKGYVARASEVGARASRRGGDPKPEDPSAADEPSRAVGTRIAELAKRYADRYFGITAAQRRWYGQLGVDPYTNNPVLREAVVRVAKLEAAAGVALRYANVPEVPYAGELRRAMNAIQNEDPRIIRRRERATLKSYGLEDTEIALFQNTSLLSPTRQLFLSEAAKTLDGVEGRAELFRHATAVTTEEEMQVFLESTGLLARIHTQRPVKQILPGLRVPTALDSDGRVVVVGSFDAVRWTREVAGHEAELRRALPADSRGRELWLSGEVSSRIRAELADRGWEVRDDTLKRLRPAEAA